MEKASKTAVLQVEVNNKSHNFLAINKRICNKFVTSNEKCVNIFNMLQIWNCPVAGTICAT